jgi:hypothetical protein
VPNAADPKKLFSHLVHPIRVKVFPRMYQNQRCGDIRKSFINSSEDVTRGYPAATC